MAFDLNKLREYIPTELPKMPSWPTNHSSMNPDDDDYTPRPKVVPASKLASRRARRDIEMIEEPMPGSHGPKSNIQLLNECDNFPHYQVNPKAFFAHINVYYAFYVKDFPDTELGYVLPTVAEIFRGLPDWKLDDEARTLTLITGSNEAERSRLIETMTKAMQATDHFKVLRGWRGELYPVYGPNGELLFSIERSASALFGLVTYGCHMTGYVKSESTEEGDSSAGMKIWVPRRAQHKQTYGGMLDNTVAGGLATGETPLECIVREAAEEATLPEDLVRKHARAAGTVSYFHIRDWRAGGETRLLQPEIQYVYDIELPADMIPRPSDNEVEGFELKTVEETKAALRGGEFKPNCALVLLDFFVRHGILTAADEGYVEIVSRLHRKLEFPTP